MKLEEISKLMMLIGAEFPGTFKTSPERVVIWQRVLGDFEYAEAVEATIDVIGRGREFPPNVGTIREQILLRREARDPRPALPQFTPFSLPEPEKISEEGRAKIKALLADFQAKTAKKEIIQ